MRASPSSECSIDGCDKPVLGRGWCSKHYNRWWKHGDPELLLIKRHEGDVVERFWAKVEKTDTCWNWIAACNDAGYGLYKVNGKSTAAHRFAYEIAIEAIPDRLEIDHRCHNRRCVNPAHLRPVTPKQNCENQSGARSNSKSGVRGVHWSRVHQRWIAKVTHRGRVVYSRQFRDLDEAAAAVVVARNKYFTHNDVDRLPVKVQ